MYSFNRYGAGSVRFFTEKVKKVLRLKLALGPFDAGELYAHEISYFTVDTVFHPSGKPLFGTLKAYVSSHRHRALHL
jgi:hypothetical protein